MGFIVMKSDRTRYKDNEGWSMFEFNIASIVSCLPLLFVCLLTEFTEIA